MGFTSLFYPWGFLLQAVAIVHFVRRRPETYWLWIILVGGALGAFVYIVAEILPDAALLRASMHRAGRKRRMGDLEAVIADNSAIANVEELAGLCLEERQFARARELYDKVIAAHPDDVDARYRRGLAALEMGDARAAVPDLEHTVARDPKYDIHRASGLLAHAYGLAGRPDQADTAFQNATSLSTLSETYYNYALFLAGQQRVPEAREWAGKILAKRPTMPRFLRRRERPWFRKAAALLKKLPG